MGEANFYYFTCLKSFQERGRERQRKRDTHVFGLPLWAASHPRLTYKIKNFMNVSYSSLAGLPLAAAQRATKSITHVDAGLLTIIDRLVVFISAYYSLIALFLLRAFCPLGVAQ